MTRITMTGRQQTGFGQMFLALLVALSMFAGAAAADGPAAAPVLQVTEPWVRATVAGQAATGAFMTLTAGRDGRLVAADSPVAATVEVHEMAMDGDIMRMREIEALPLPAGEAVPLQPGGYHIMLIGLVAPLSDGQSVPLSLTFESADGVREQIAVDASVRPLTHRGKSPMH